MGNVGHRACGCGCLRGLRRADLQSGEEETQQKDVDGHWSGSICWGDSGGHSDRPDADANLIGQTVCVCPAKYGISRKDQDRRAFVLRSWSFLFWWNTQLLERKRERNSCVLA